jgi:hypothetical protein
MSLGMSNANGLAIYAIEPTSGALDKRQRRSPRTAADIEDAAAPTESEQFGNFSLLGCSAPTLLPNIFAKDFAPQLHGDIAIEGSIFDSVKVGARFARGRH